MSLRLLVLLLLCLGAASARADAIDGDWCAADGRHIAIHGPEITLPGHQKLQGDYARHEFAYIAPPNDPDTGFQIFFNLLSEEHANRYRVNKSGELSEPELWRRCEVTS